MTWLLRQIPSMKVLVFNLTLASRVGLVLDETIENYEA